MQLQFYNDLKYRTHTNRRRVYYFPARLFGGSSNRIFSRGSFIGEGLVISMKKNLTRRGLVLWYRIACFAKNDCNFFDNCIKGHNTFKLNCNHNTVLLKMTLKPIAILKGSCNSCKVLYQRRSSIFLDYFQRGLLFEFLKGVL